jgi:uncharacterized protein (DUF1330 family)
VAAARRFYESKEYQAIIELREQASDTRLILVEGYDAPGWTPPV